MIALRFSKRLIKELHKMLAITCEANDLRSYKITQCLLWIAEQRAISEISGLLNISRHTPYDWLKKFISGGVDWINSKRYVGRGRKGKLTKREKEKLRELVVQGPEANGFDTAVWNTALINELIFREFNVTYNPHYLSKLLKKMGLSYQKAAFVTDRESEEEYQQQRETWLKITWPTILKKAKQNDSVILFGDEVSFAMWGSLSRTWAPRGEQPLVKTKGIRKGLKMYGVIEFENGGFHYMESLQYTLKPKSFRMLKEAGVDIKLIELIKPLKDVTFKTLPEFVNSLTNILGKERVTMYEAVILQFTQTSGRFNKEGYVEFLKQVMMHFEGNIILIEDGAPYHNSGLVKKFVENTNGQLTLERLPTFSPDLNPIEKLWKNTKRDATHLKYFETFEKLRESVCTAFKKYLMNPSQITCVMKKLLREANTLALAKS
jgi:transposase